MNSVQVINRPTLVTVNNSTSTVGVVVNNTPRLVKISMVGTQGVPGKSAYQSWLDAGNTGTESDFVSVQAAVQSVNGMTGTVEITAASIGAEIAGGLSAHLLASDAHLQYLKTTDAIDGGNF
jgi:hypothetical protein